jgi:hypothetical protein
MVGHARSLLGAVKQHAAAGVRPHLGDAGFPYCLQWRSASACTALALLANHLSVRALALPGSDGDAAHARGASNRLGECQRSHRRVLLCQRHSARRRGASAKEVPSVMAKRRLPAGRSRTPLVRWSQMSNKWPSVQDPPPDNRQQISPRIFAETPIPQSVRVGAPQ